MYQSIPHMLFSTIKKYPDKDVLRFKRKGSLKSYTYAEFGELVRNLGNGLASLGVKPGDRVGLLADNCPEWPLTDFASLSIGALVVPVYPSLPAKQIAYILKDAKVNTLFMDNETQYEKVKAIKSELKNVAHLISFDTLDTKNVRNFDDLMSEGQMFRREHPEFFKQAMDNIDKESLCSIVYTSGTTGLPKGVMLHHKGFIEEIISSEDRLNLDVDDVFLSFLPLTHLYERVAGHWTPMYKGNTIHYAQGIQTVIDDILEARPTVMVSVPRLYEKVADRVMEEVEHSSNMKRKIFYWALKTGRAYHNARIEGKNPFWLKRKYKIADSLVFQKIKQKLGGRLRYPIAGGAPLSTSTLKFFEALDMQIIEGYGMTEAHLIIALTPFGKTRYGSCGQPIDVVDLKIAEDGEVLVKGPTIMAGYYNQPDLTRQVIDQEGWLHTGDIGHLDKDYYLYLTDRKKNILVTTGGKNVAPAPIEMKLKRSKYVDEVCVLGDQRKFISALVVPNYEEIRKWAKSHDIVTDSNAALVNNEQVKRFVWEEIKKQQAEFARYERVKKIALLSEPFSIEKGELTPSLKVKRKVVEQRYQSVIEQLYGVDEVI